MKIRNGFVTNSSSSSFIISNDLLPLDKDALFLMIVSIYKSTREKMEAFKPHAAKYHVHYNEATSFFDFDDDNIHYQKRHEIEKTVERIYGIDISYAIPGEFEWMKLNTYKEYEEYWKLHGGKDIGDGRIYPYAPFTIVDLSTDETYTPIHYAPYNGDDTDDDDSDTLDGVVRFTGGWYLPCFSELSGDRFANLEIPKFVETLQEEYPFGYCDSCIFNPEQCIEFLTRVKNSKDALNGKVEDLKKIFKVEIGSLCIMSECGLIPYPIAEKIGELCSYWCAHMG